MGFPKVLLSRNQVLLIHENILKLKEAGWGEIAVVLSDRSLEQIVSSCHYNIEFNFNSDPDAGMISSIRLGLEWARSDSAGILTWPIDVPFVEKDTLEQIRGKVKPNRIVIPSFKNRRGHPAFWGKEIWKRLKDKSADNGAKQVLYNLNDSIIHVEVNDPGILLNFNTQEAAEKHGLHCYT